MERSGIADLLLHGGSEPKWLADRHRFATGLELDWYGRAFDNLLNNLLRLFGLLQS